MAEDQVFDIVVIGAGPAGLSAAINSTIRKKDILVLSNSPTSYRLARAPKVDNYLGMADLSGVEMNRAFLQHAKSMGVEVREENVTNVLPGDGSFAVLSDKGFYQARSVLLAVGMPTKADIPGESDLLGRGVSYCATCDGPLYKEKEVGVIGYMHDAEEEVEYLCQVASKVYYLPQYPIEHVRSEKLTSGCGEKITILSGKPREITADGSVHLRYEGSSGEQSVDVAGLFVLRPAVPVANLLPGLEMIDGSIKVDRDMATNIPGVYAAGDCTGAPWQVAKAVGEGQIAALSIVKYLSNL